VLWVVILLEEEEGGTKGGVGVVVVVEWKEALPEDLDILEPVEVAINTNEIADALRMDSAPDAEAGAKAPVSLLLLHQLGVENVLPTTSATPPLPVARAEHDLRFIAIDHDAGIEHGLVGQVGIFVVYGLTLGKVGRFERELLALCEASKAKS
jgi:hypothetical protein